MLATLFRSAKRRGIAAGLAAVVATAGIGAAMAAPSGAPEERPTAAIGAISTIGETAGDAAAVIRPHVEVPVTTPVIDDDAAGPEEVSTPAPPPPNVSRPAPSIPVPPPVDASRFLPEGGDLFDRETLQGLLPGDASADEASDGTEELARGVVARIQECVSGVVGDIDFGGSSGGGGWDFTAGGSAGVDESSATSVVDDVLPCVSGLVDDALACVSGLVEEILATVTSMDFGEIAGLAGVIVDELVDCVVGTQAD